MKLSRRSTSSPASLERQHARPRAGGRGAQAPHGLRGRLHRFPLRQGRAEPPLHLPHHEHPVGRRRDVRPRHRADMAQGQRIAHIHPDYSYGRNAFDHVSIVMKKMMPRRPGGVRGLAQARHDRLRVAHHQGDRGQAGPPRVLGVGRRLRGHVQAGPPLRHVQEDEAGEHVAFGVAPHAIGKDHPEGAIAGVHSNYYFNSPRRTVAAQQQRSSRGTSTAGRSTRTSRPRAPTSTMHMLEMAIESANKLMGGWPDDETIISQLENLGMAGPRGTCTSGQTTTRLQGRGDRLQHELAGYRSRSWTQADDHDPDPQHHGASRLAEGRADVDVHLDRQDLAKVSA